MYRLQKFSIVPLLIWTVIVGIGIWWFVRIPDINVPAPAKVDGAKIATQANLIEKPTASAAPAKSEPAGLQANLTPLAQNADPHTDLKTALPDMARIIREKGPFALEQAYWPPDEVAAWTPERVKERQAYDAKWANDLKFQQLLETKAQYYEMLATLTPTLNAAGDKATYVGFSPGNDGTEGGTPHIIAIFAKINGKWYYKDDWSDEP